MTPPPLGPRPRVNGRWVVAASVVVLVVALAVTSWAVTRSGSERAPATASPPPTTPAVAPTEIASATDDDPVTVITEDSTCPAWEPIANALLTVVRNGWHERDPQQPAAAWSPEQRRQYLAVAEAMREAADKTVGLATATPHRVMRELYEQTIAYWRAYSASIDRYRPADDHLALTASNFAGSIASICAAIDFGAASARGPLVLPGPPPVPAQAPTDPANPAAFIATSSSFCTEWTSMVFEYRDATRPWRDGHDVNVPASQWNPQQRALSDDAVAVMEQNADQAQLLGLLSGDLVTADVAALSAHYRRAYALALPTYGLPDTHLETASARLQSAVEQACRAVGG